MGFQPDGMVALVTGANRGLGFEVCRQLAQRNMTVLLAARDREKGEAAANELKGMGLNVRAVELDVSDDASVRRLADGLCRDPGRLDVLVNNAGGFYDADARAGNADLAHVRDALETNLFGAWRVCQALLPLLKASPQGRVVNVSSEAGSFTAGKGLGTGGYGSSPGGLPAYGVSKAALNALTVKLAAELRESGVLVNSVCPGFTATQPGSESWGARPVAEGAASVVWAATLPDDGPTGGFFRDGEPLPW